MIEREIHIPVMLNEAIKCLAPEDGKVYVDGTFGSGGHSVKILESAECKVLAVDRDPDVKKIAIDLKSKFSKKIDFIQGCFGDLKQLLNNYGISKVDGILLDIGVSSMQIDRSERGFSFMKDGPLDMRMSKEGLDAAYVVNNMSEEDLANIIYRYGDEKKSRKIARAIVKAREIKLFSTTLELAKVIHSVFPFKVGKIDSATRTFQAIRIYVNNELEELERVLKDSEELLSIGGRIVVITFHSIEDRIVKSFLRSKEGKKSNVSRHLPVLESVESKPIFKIPVRRVITPSEEEINNNIRARSAKLRFAIKT